MAGAAEESRSRYVIRVATRERERHGTVLPEPPEMATRILAITETVKRDGVRGQILNRASTQTTTSNSPTSEQ